MTLAHGFEAWMGQFLEPCLLLVICRRSLEQPAWLLPEVAQKARRLPLLCGVLLSQSAKLAND